MSSPLTIFQSLYEPLLYHGPGSETSTLRALSAIPELPGAPEILDIGCGAGRQTLQVVAQSGGRALGLDLSRHALSQLASRARKAGFDGEEREIASVVAKQSNLEMDVLRKSRSSYSYVFYIMRKPD